MFLVSMPQRMAAVRLAAQEKKTQKEDHQGAGPDHPQHLGGNPGAEYRDAGDFITDEVWQGPDIVTPDMQGGLPDEDRDTDSDNDHPQDTWVFQPADKDNLDERPDTHGQSDRQSDRQ